MTFLKALVLCMAAQGVLGSVLGAISEGLFFGQPLALLSGGVSDLASRAFGTALASILPSIVVVAALVAVAPRVPRATRLHWIFGGAVWSGAVWRLGPVPLYPEFASHASAYTLAGAISGGIVGLHMWLTRQHPTSQDRSPK